MLKLVAALWTESTFTFLGSSPETYSSDRPLGCDWFLVDKRMAWFLGGRVGWFGLGFGAFFR